MRKSRFRPQVRSLEARSVPSGVPASWSVRGSGGGGALFSPQINPANPGELFVSSDMGELFRSADTGTSWQQVDFRQLRGNHETKVQYTEVPGLVYALDYTDELPHAEKSLDGGKTWQPLPSDPTDGGAYYLAANPANHNQLVVTDYRYVYYSADAGQTWALKYTGQDANAGLILGGAFWDGSTVYLGTNDGVIRSTNGGQSFALMPAGGIPAGKVIRSFAGGKQGSVTRFVAVTDDAGDTYGGVQGYDNNGGTGVYTLDVGASNWVARPLPGGAWPFFAGMAATDTGVLYAAGGSDASTPTVYKSADGGASWTSVFKTAGNANVQTGWSGAGGDRDWWYGETAMGFAVDAADANRLVITDYGFAHGSTDGGATWQVLTVAPADRNPAGATTPKGKSYHDSGLDNTTSWGVTWADPNTLFLSNSDIKGQRSTNGGQTFGFGYTGHSLNSMYRVAKHSSGKLYGATGSVHDLYQSTYLTDARIDGGTGQVLASADKGASWQVIKDFGDVVSWVYADPANPERLYASVVNRTAGGIYVTNNLSAGAAATWTRLAGPPRTEGHPFNILTLNDGTLVVSYSGRRDGAGAFTASSGVFASTDGGQTWQDRSAAGMRYWTKDIVVDPHDPTQDTWYAGVFSGWGGAPNNTGGLYKTTDRGLTWARLLGGLDRVTSIAFNPADPAEAFVTTETQGLWYSNLMRSANPSFTQVQGYPFAQPERVFFNPYNPSEVWVTSFGGGVMVGTTGSAPAPAGTLQFGAAAYSVGEGGGTVTLTVTRVGGSAGSLSASFATANGSATAGGDFTAATGTLTWAAGDTAPKTITVSILDDSLVEGSEAFTVSLAGAAVGSPATATVTIADNDSPPPPTGTLQFSSATYSVGEGGGAATVTVTRVGGSAGVLTASYSTANGIATAGSDYTAASGTLTWADGDTAPKTFTVPVLDDTAVEGAETVLLALTSAALGGTSKATLTITDNDTPPPPPPPPPGGGKPFAVGTDSGTPARVTLFNPDGSARWSASPFGGFTGGVRVATGDVTGDGVPDVVAGTGGGVRASVKVIDGKTGQPLPGELSAGPWYYGPASVAVGDVTGDGVADVVVGSSEGGGMVRVYRGGDFLKLAEFAAGPTANYWGRTEVAVADLTGDGLADVAVTGQYPTGNRVAGFAGPSLRPGLTPVAAFAPFVLTGRGFEAAPTLAAGDLNGDGFADLVFGSGQWATTRVLALSGKELVQAGSRVTLADFAPTGPAFAGGVRVAARDLTGDGRAEIVVGAGPGRGSRVRAYSGAVVVFDFDAVPGFAGGVFVG